ncbi:hypothetical protein BY996DRAFT_7304479 [Phakopsora pachyrhizi]|nr:hypothetical protein BY996DRAFT_7304479 [Phakopsora pachyrhizi]
MKKTYVVFANPPRRSDLLKPSSTATATPSLSSKSYQNLINQWITIDPSSEQGPINRIKSKEQEEKEDVYDKDISKSYNPSTSSPKTRDKPIDPTSASEKLFKIFNQVDSPNIRCYNYSDLIGKDRVRSDRTEVDDLRLGEQSRSISFDESFSLDYYQSQLDYLESFKEEEDDELSCNKTLMLIDRTEDQSLVTNLPQWFFDHRRCTALDRLSPDPNNSYQILFYLLKKRQTESLEMKGKNHRKVDLAHFDCLDETGALLNLTLWEEAARELEPACYCGDIIYLSGLSKKKTPVS